MSVKLGTAEYLEHVAEEKASYSRLYEGEEAKGLLMEPCPEAWTALEGRMSRLLVTETGKTRDEHVCAVLKAGAARRLLSLGCGPGGVECVFARLCPDSLIHGIDLNPDLLKLGEERARNERLAVSFEEADLNTLILPPNRYDVVFCHAALHHVLELEHLTDQIRRTLKPHGRLIVEDVIMRNGTLMWPETKEVVTGIWRALPERYRVNHTAYDAKRVDAEPWDADTSAVSMECIRSEDVLPVLHRQFKPIHSLTYLSLCMRFFHHMYGPNFDLRRPFDAAFFEWIWQLDATMIAEGRLRGEAHFGVYAVQ